jgi:predicted DNA-binding transcriptional regulator YafY
MNIIRNKSKLERLDQLIRLKATGTPEELSDKLGTNKRTIYRIINELKEIGCPIYFSKDRNSYCYKYEGELVIKFDKLEKQELVKIKGGLMKKDTSSDKFCHQKALYLPRKIK